MTDWLQQRDGAQASFTTSSVSTTADKVSSYEVSQHGFFSYQWRAATIQSPSCHATRCLTERQMEPMPMRDWTSKSKRQIIQETWKWINWWIMWYCSYESAMLSQLHIDAFCLLDASRMTTRWLYYCYWLAAAAVCAKTNYMQVVSQAWQQATWRAVDFLELRLCHCPRIRLLVD